MKPCFPDFTKVFTYKDGELYREGKLAGTITTTGYRQVSVDNKLYLAHRVIFAMHWGFLPRFIDHIDGNSENNAIDNLRESSKSLNACNAKLPSHNTSGTKGVIWAKRENKWIARVQINKKIIHLGTFKDLDLASLVADEARILYHGKHARI